MSILPRGDRGTIGIDVTTSDGAVRGKRINGLISWCGIPYAAPPVGPLRLRAPQQPSPWRGTRSAEAWGAASLQAHAPLLGVRSGRQSMSEDCLTVNVLAPAESSPALRPVMVFIHGGGYTMHSSAFPLYDGTSLVRRSGIVFVSFNYRLGALGYLNFSCFSSPNRPIDTNLGLRDQASALDWVRRNITGFGGDPENVTIFGESAGGNAVITLMATPATAGLFHRAIAESCPPGMVSTAERSTAWAQELIDILRLDAGNTAERLENASPTALREAAAVLDSHVYERTPGLRPYGPVIDGDFLPEQPIDAFRAGRAHRVPLIIGTNSDEGIVFDKYLDVMPTNPVRVHTMFEQTDPDSETRITAAYRRYPAASAAIELGADCMFWRPSVAIAEAHSKHAPTYFYSYEFAPRLLHLLGLHATHATELLAVFGIFPTIVGKVLTMLGGRRAAADVTAEVQSHWIAFARTGSPLSTWPAYDTLTRSTRIINAPSRNEDDPHSSKRLAWAGYRWYDGVTF